MSDPSNSHNQNKVLFSEDRQLWEQTAIASYNTVRQEIHNVHNFILALCSALIAGLGAVSSFGLSSTDLTFKLGIFFVVVPIATYLSGLLWASLNVMMMRAGTYLVELERQIIEAMPRSRAPILWEHFVRSGNIRLTTPRFWETTIAIVFTPSLASIAYGIFLSPWSNTVNWVIALVELVLWVGFIVYCWRFVLRSWEVSRDIVANSSADCQK